MRQLNYYVSLFILLTQGNRVLTNVNGLSSVTSMDHLYFYVRLGCVSQCLACGTTGLHCLILIQQNKALLNVDGLSRVSCIRGNLEILVFIPCICGVSSYFRCSGLIDLFPPGKRRTDQCGWAFQCHPPWRLSIPLGTFRMFQVNRQLQLHNACDDIPNQCVLLSV